MRANWIRGLGLSLVLAITSLEVAAQRTGRMPETPQAPGASGTSSCWGNGAECLFGSSSDCTVSCRSPLVPHCRSGRCVFGFPRSAVCECRGLEA